MSKLKAVKPKATNPKKPAILIFGEAGIGKTWASLDFPNVYYIDSERGATNAHYQDKLEKSGGVYLGIEQGSQNFDDIIEQVRALRSEPHDFKTLVIDSFTVLFQTEIAREQERLKREKKNDEFGLSKKPAVSKSRQLTALLGSLDMNIILICHAKPKWEDGEQKGFEEDAWEKLRYLLDLTMEIKKQGTSRKAMIRKSRLEKFPEGTLIDWSYQEFAERWGKDVIEKSSDVVQLATKEQLERVARLIDALKLDEETKDKYLGWANVPQFSDMSSDQITKVIENLESKLK